MVFEPVQVSRGRKFRGFAYYLSEEERPIAYGVEYYCATLWDPKAKRRVYANSEFCEDVDVSAEQLEADKKAYIDSTIQSTVEWCKKTFKDKSERELSQLARNILRKHHPEMADDINKAIPDGRDVVSEVDKTFKWAMSLKTQPMYIFGKHCPGGKQYPPEHVVKVAYKALRKRGVTALDGFKDAWALEMTLMAFPDISLSSLEEECCKVKECA